MVHGSAERTQSTPSSPGLTRCGRTPGVRAPACGSGHGRRWPPRSPDAVRARAQRVADHPFVAARSPPRPWRAVVAGRLLPAHAPVLGDAAADAGRAASARSRPSSLGTARRARRHDDGRLGMALGDAGVDALPVVRAVAGERGDRTRDLVEQRADLRAVIDLVGVSSAATIWPVSASTPRCSLRQDRRGLVPCFSTSHSPGPHSFRPVLSTSRCTGSLPERGAAAPPTSRPGGSGSSGPARRDRARAGEGWSRSAPRSGAAPGGTRPGASGPSGSPGASTGAARPGGARLRPPGRDRLLREPDRQAATLAQGGVVVRPVGDPVPLLGDVVTASSVGLERHGRRPGIVGGVAPLPDLTPRRHPDRSGHHGPVTAMRPEARHGPTVDGLPG